uniref:HMA domain-containing protein n=1 Tax=Oryza brachyantha TaxID=4533 RepID=J3MW16_ORYBR
MPNEKTKSKVMQIIVKHSAIISITADMDKGKVTVVGNESMDVTDLTRVLRKKMHAPVAIGTVTQVDERKEKEEKERKRMEEEYCRNLWHDIYQPPYPMYPHHMYASLWMCRLELEMNNLGKISIITLGGVSPVEFE